MDTTFSKLSITTWHPERSRAMREADGAAESKDPYAKEIAGMVTRVLPAKCNAALHPDRVGVLRLRKNFASRSSYFAQNDSL